MPRQLHGVIRRRASAFCVLLFLALPRTGAEEPGRPSVGPFLGGALPRTAPGRGHDWRVRPAFPHLAFDDPVFLAPEPRSDRLYVCGRQGTLHSFVNDPETQTKALVLDLTARTQGWHDCGLLCVAFHPEFGKPGSPNRGYFYLYYVFTEKPTPGPRPPPWEASGRYNRLSRFLLPDGSRIADPESELVLVDQYDRHIFHNGGALLFGPDGFLYFTNGDEGGLRDQYGAAQRLNGGLFSGVFRIDVDRDPSRSHPIRRSPQTVEPGYPSSTGHYFIPNDNPFVSESGDVLEEFWAFGLRSPDAMTRDPVTGAVWVSDVGQALREEVNLLKKGANYQWAFLEGTAPGPKARVERPAGTNPVRGEVAPVYEYRHGSGNNSIVGGYVYRGRRLAAELGGKYIFGDNGSGRIWALTTAENLPPRVEYLTRMPPGTGWKGFSRIGLDHDGELLFCKMGHPGGIYRLESYRDATQESTPAPPVLSATGAFGDIGGLEPSSGVIPYAVNAPLWSDGASKRRWIALPGDARPDGAIHFSALDRWSFPVGTVFIKHFEITAGETHSRRLETRFLVHGEDGIYYGLTYKWRDDQSEADLLEGELTEEVLVGSRRQPWYYPSRDDCMVCHTASAGYVLGVNTQQLNGASLSEWSRHGMFRKAPTHAELARLPRAVGLGDDGASLESRARSYLDSNCAMCHRPGVVRSRFDARLSTPLQLQGLINGPLTSPSAIPGATLVQPGDVSRSVLYDRLAREDHLKMPPLARNVVHHEALDILRRWIESLE